MAYENLQALLKEDLVFVAESDTEYFIRVRPTETFDVSMWRVDKETGLASYIEFTTFAIEHLDRDAREIDVDEFKGRFA